MCRSAPSAYYNSGPDILGQEPVRTSGLTARYTGVLDKYLLNTNYRATGFYINMWYLHGRRFHSSTWR